VICIAILFREIKETVTRDCQPTDSEACSETREDKQSHGANFILETRAGWQKLWTSNLTKETREQMKLIEC